MKSYFLKKWYKRTRKCHMLQNFRPATLTKTKIIRCRQANKRRNYMSHLKEALTKTQKASIPNNQPTYYLLIPSFFLFYFFFPFSLLINGLFFVFSFYFYFLHFSFLAFHYTFCTPFCLFLTPILFASTIIQ